jgi:hypothetical protein
MGMKKLKYLIIGFLVASTSACTHRQVVKYSMDDIPSLTNSPFAKAVVAVKPFKDDRKPLLIDCPSMEVSKIEKGEKTYYYNCDNRYKTDSLAKEISNKLVDHINRAHVFEKAILADVPSSEADYLLTGQLSKFDGLKEYKLGAVVASSFGLLGALVNLANDSDFEATTIFDNVQLIRTKDGAVIWNGNITGHIEGADTVDPYGWSAYWKANLSLKEANAKLITEFVNIKVNPLQVGEVPSALLVK